MRITVKQLKQWLDTFPNDANVLIYVDKAPMHNTYFALHLNGELDCDGDLTFEVTEII